MTSREATLPALETLPALSPTLVHLVSLSAADEHYKDKVIRALGRDPGIAVRAIDLANSVLYAGVARVDTVRNAVQRLGARTVVSHLVKLDLVATLMPDVPELRRLWEHALFVADGARRLVAGLRVPAVDPDQAYLAGLLHDIGLLAMATVRPDSFETRAWLDTGSSTEFLDRERMAWGEDHTLIGAGLVTRWGLPAWLLDIVRGHHDVAPPQTLGVAMVVRFVDAAADAAFARGRSIQDPLAVAEAERAARELDSRLPDRPLLPPAEFHGFLEATRTQAALECRLLGFRGPARPGAAAPDPCGGVADCPPERASAEAPPPPARRPALPWPRRLILALRDIFRGG